MNSLQTNICTPTKSEGITCHNNILHVPEMGVVGAWVRDEDELAQFQPRDWSGIPTLPISPPPPIATLQLAYDPNRVINALAMSCNVLVWELQKPEEQSVSVPSSIQVLNLEADQNECDTCPLTSFAVASQNASDALEYAEPRLITIDVIADTLSALAKSGYKIPERVLSLVSILRCSEYENPLNVSGTSVDHEPTTVVGTVVGGLVPPPIQIPDIMQPETVDSISKCVTCLFQTENMTGDVCPACYETTLIEYKPFVLEREMQMSELVDWSHAVPASPSV